VSPTDRPAAPSADVPAVSAFLQNGFHAFLGRMLRRSFHTLAGERETLANANVAADQPLIVFANHPSWWDPLVAHYVNRQLFAGRQFYAPIDAEALDQYRVFAKLGFFGVRLGSPTGSAAFLKTSRTILAMPGTALWMTPEGRFVDPRDTEQPLAPGLAHLCSRAETGVALPLAMEFAFWEERLPECLLRFGEPILIAEHAGLDKPAWAARLTASLRDNQQQLAKRVIARDATPFQELLRGSQGAGGMYERLRRLRGWLGGSKVAPQHGKQFQ